MWNEIYLIHDIIRLINDWTRWEKSGKRQVTIALYLS